MIRTGRTMTKAQRAKLARLDATREAATTAVYAAVDNTHTPFSECLKAASAEVRTAYEAACTARYDLERELVADRRGYFSGHNWAFRAY